MKKSTGTNERKKKGFGRIVLAGLLLAAIVFAAIKPCVYAEDIDLDRKDGSVTLLLQYEDSETSELKKMEGGEVTLYKVSKIVQNEKGEYLFDVSTGQFPEASGMDKITERLEAESSTLAAKLAELTESKKGITAEVKDGSITIGDLAPGLYLMTQSGSSSNHLKFAPFLFTIPYDGKYQVTHSSDYSLTAKPKLRLEEEPTLPPESGEVTTPEETPPETTTPSTTPPETTKPSESEPPTTTAVPPTTTVVPPTNPPSNPPSNPPTGGRIPQTGQLWWPVPLLFLAGFFLAMTGLAVRIKA